MAHMPDEVRGAIERLMTDYCYTLDDMADVDALMALFTEDAVTDMTALGVPLMGNRAAMRSFFAAVFAGNSHSFHFLANTRPESWDGTVAAMTAYVIGMGRTHGGSTVTARVRYRMECVETAEGWKCRHYTVTPLMPMEGSVDSITAAD